MEQEPTTSELSTAARASTGPLVVTDLDGSLWDHELRCHPSTIEALSHLADRRIQVLVATGRRANSARGGLADNGLCFPSVLLNGSIGIDFPSEEVFHQHPFSAAEASSIVAGLADVNCAAVMYLEMLAAADVAIGVEGGHREVLDRADHIVASPDRGGWVRVLDFL